MAEEPPVADVGGENPHGGTRSRKRRADSRAGPSVSARAAETLKRPVWHRR